jgi:hypothetical protein
MVLSRRTFIARAAAFVAGVRLALDGALAEFVAPEAHAEVKPAVETTWLRVDPDTLEFEYLSENGWVNTGHAMQPWMSAGYDVDLPFPLAKEAAIQNFRADIANGSLTRCWKKAAMPKKEVTT